MNASEAKNTNRKNQDTTVPPPQQPEPKPTPDSGPHDPQTDA